MRLLLCLLLIPASLIFCHAQVFDIGAMGIENYVSKSSGQIIITDSVYSIKMPGVETDRTITDRTDAYTIYVTDGRAVDQIVISKMSAKIVGYKYDHIIIYNEDKKFNGAKIIYYCRQRH